MQHIVFLTVGKPKNPWITAGCAQFLERLKPHMRIEWIHLQPSKQIEPEKYREEETEAILKKMEKLDGDLWLLDERGKGMTSVDFSKEIAKAKDDGRSIIFILGGAYGVGDALKKKAPRTLRLSEMTFPHEFCALVFLEQLYRASEIERGTGYHH